MVTIADTKLAQWARVHDKLPGLSLSRTGKNADIFILRIWNEAIGEDGIILHKPAYQAVRNGAVVNVPGINVSNRELDEVIETWRRGLRAAQPRGYAEA